MNSLPLSLSLSTPMIGNGMIIAISSSAAITRRRPLFLTERFWRPAGRDVGDRQGVAVIAEGVAAFVPDQVDLDEPGHGVVPLRPGADRDLGLQQRRSIVAGDIATSSAAVWSLTCSSSKRRSVGTSSLMIGASRLPVGAPSTAQQNAKAAITSLP